MLIRQTAHWTGGWQAPNWVDRRAYHFLYDGDGNQVQGNFLPEANVNLIDGLYAAHAGDFNTGNIGHAVCGMVGAMERPFRAPREAYTRKALEALAKGMAQCCKTYNIKVSADTIHSHSEVLPRYGRGVHKWDINWWANPDGSFEMLSPQEAGDRLRDMVAMDLSDDLAEPSRIDELEERIARIERVVFPVE